MWHEMNIYEVLKAKNTNEKVGLTSKEAMLRKQEFGGNKLEEKRKKVY